MSSPYFTRHQLKKRNLPSAKAIASLKAITKRRKTVKVEYDENEDNESTKAQHAVQIKQENKDNKDEKYILNKHSLRKINDLTTTEELNHWEPLNWKKVLENIKKMRSKRDAVVDTLGCERTFDRNASAKDRRFQILISLMLSSQTRDQMTSAAMDQLKEHGLNAVNIMMTSETDIENLIKMVGFKKRKAEYLLKASTICHNQYQNDIPDTLEGLMSLPGVGPKMAHICMNVAWGKISGIGVDTHVHRISNRLNWVKKTTKQPEQTRIELEKWLPRDEWSDINVLLVGFGQQTCLPVGPKCGSCLVNQYCSVGRSIIKKEKTK